MASSSSLSLCFLLVASMIAFIGASNEYKVGDSEGWKVPAENDRGSYKTWASKIKFLVGDSIVFEYQNDSVVKVSKRGYYHCNETSKGAVFKDGRTMFLLDEPGFYYFVSGDVEHCKKGQRLMIEVVGLSPSVSASPSVLPNAATLPFVSSFLAAVAVGSWRISLIII